MNHIGIVSIGLELVSLLQASSSPLPWIQMWPIYLYLCNEGFLKKFKGRQRKMFIVFTPKYFDNFCRLILLTA